MGEALLRFLLNIIALAGLLYFGMTGEVAAQQGGDTVLEGWRGWSSQAENISFKQVLAGTRVQGIPGSAEPGAEPTIMSWKEQEGGFFVYPESITDYLQTGKGYYIYLFGNSGSDAAGALNSLLKTPAAVEAPPGRLVEIPVSATDADESGHIDGMEGFNLLGNPFASKLSVGALKEELAGINTNINRYLYIWNPELGGGNGGFELLNDADVIAPAQPFWMRYLDKGINGIVRFDPDRLVADIPRETYRTMDVLVWSFELELATGEWFDSYRIELREDGEVGEDRLDGYKLFSLKPGSVNLYSPIAGGSRLARNVLPRGLVEEIEVPLQFSAAAGTTAFSFNWERPAGLPSDWDLILTDRKRSRELNLRTAGSYSFTREDANVEQASLPREQLLLDTRNRATTADRFFLTIRPPGSKEENETEVLPESIKLKPNYPNPFTSMTTIPYELDETTEVTLTVWNMIGQKVATLIDNKSRQPGREHAENWNAAAMPSGMYIARLEAGGEVFTRKMTLIK